MGHPYIKNVYPVYLKFSFNWVSSVLSDNPMQGSQEHKTEIYRRFFFAGILALYRQVGVFSSLFTN